MHNLVLTNGRIIDPGSGRDFLGAVAFKNSRVAGIGPSVRGDRFEQVVDVNGAIIIRWPSHRTAGLTSRKIGSEPPSHALEQDES